MTNNWIIPSWLEKEIRDRDKRCVYCRAYFTSTKVKKTATSWEHIINDASIISRKNIALCCCSCNANKGQKLLHVLFVKNFMERVLEKRFWSFVNHLALKNKIKVFA